MSTIPPKSEVKIAVVVRQNGKLYIRSNVKGVLAFVYDENDTDEYPMLNKMPYKVYEDGR